MTGFRQTATSRMPKAALMLAAALAASAPLSAAGAERFARLRPLDSFKKISVEHCIDYLARHGTYFGDPHSNRWHPNNIAWLCAINEGWQEVPPRAVQCFSKKLESGLNWSRSIVACHREAG